MCGRFRPLVHQSSGIGTGFILDVAEASNTDPQQKAIEFRGYASMPPAEFIETSGIKEGTIPARQENARLRRADETALRCLLEPIRPHDWPPADPKRRRAPAARCAKRHSVDGQVARPALPTGRPQYGHGLARRAARSVRSASARSICSAVYRARATFRAISERSAGETAFHRAPAALRACSERAAGSEVPLRPFVLERARELHESEQ